MVGQPRIVAATVGIATQLVPLTLAVALTGCSGSGVSRLPLAPSPVPQAAPPSAPIQLLAFRDPASGFSTSDVHDADDEIVRFNTAGEIIWVADDNRFGGYSVNGDQIRGPGRDDHFQVRFGRKNSAHSRARPRCATPRGFDR